MEPKNLNYAPRGKIEYYYYAFMLYWIIEIWPSFFFLVRRWWLAGCTVAAALSDAPARFHPARQPRLIESLYASERERERASDASK